MALNKYQQRVVKWLVTRPVEVARLFGFTKLEELHNEWIVDMVRGKEDTTLQGHRGSYKTTCLSVALALIMVLYPKDKTLFMRKTSTDIAEIVAQVRRILLSEQMQYICLRLYGCNLELTVDRFDQLSTNLGSIDPRGTPQLVAMGIGGSMTGKHFDRIFTDDIVNVSDRISKAERERTKTAYQELQNIKNRGGRIFNTGTPWHIDDCFSLMPSPKKYDCYSTGLIDAETLKRIKEGMTASLFAANYELRHIAAEDVIFGDVETGADPSLAEQGVCHIDASYGGSDFTAFTIVKKLDGKYYTFGKLYQKHVDDVEDEIITLRKAFNAGRISVEDNGDKGYLAKSLRQRGERTHVYHENMNKYLKITSYLKAEWKNVIFVQGTDEEYIRQIQDYNENAEHDDAPDSLSCLVRELWKKDSKQRSDSDTRNLFYL